PAMWRGPLRQDGAVGPVIFSDVTTPLPTAAAILANSCAWIIRNWVAQAVDSAATVSTPSLRAIGVAWAGIWWPTTDGQWPRTVPSATRPDQPRFFARSRTTRPIGCGSRMSGPGPDQLRRRPATRRR